jgi:hypothetical protein
MRKTFASIPILLALVAARADAAEYLCELSLHPPAVPATMGTYGHIEFFTSSAPACGGSTVQRYLCSKGATYKFCGVDAQYSEASLIGVYETMRSAQVEQQPIVPSWDACVNAGGSCVGAILLYPTF